MSIKTWQAGIFLRMPPYIPTTRPKWTDISMQLEVITIIINTYIKGQ